MRVRVVAVCTLLLVPLLSGTAYAVSPTGVTGHDVSYPQCTSTGASTTTVVGLGGAIGMA